MTRSYIDSRLARRLRHGRKKQTGLVLGRSVFSIARRVRLPGRPAGASVGGQRIKCARINSCVFGLLLSEQSTLRYAA
ncbi:hypothetical protein J6590_083930 [Homalodisca vitripennis]|nr:hypothetical protein J6590_083930 [Homalodisca vitripennis]